MSVTVTFTYPNEFGTLLTTACCGLYGYQATIPNPSSPGQTIDNPVSPVDFAKSVFIQFGLDVVKSYQAAQAAEQARQQAIQNITQTVDTSLVQVTIETTQD